MEVGEEGDYIPIATLWVSEINYLTCHHQNDSCIKMGSHASRLMFH